jgi:dsRNA-specific ribonuclease
MEDSTEWINYRDKICYLTEEYLLGYPVQNKERLISAIISNAFINEKVIFEELKKISADTSLETKGDFVLDFVIFDHFVKRENYTAKEIDNFRQFYGRNKTLQWFAKNCIHLQEFILWGPDERKKRKWNYASTVILADRFEMLIGMIYLENGIDAVKEFLREQKFFEEIDKKYLIK